MAAYELTVDATADLTSIIDYTLEHHGVEQTQKYITQLENCAERLANRNGYYRQLTEIHPDLYVTRCQHHYIFGLMRQDGQPIAIVAILHERMDFLKRLQDIDFSPL